MARAGVLLFVVVCEASLRGELLLRHPRTAERCLEAARLYEQLYEERGDIDYALRCAEAFNAAMRVMTKGNTITIDGPVDTPQHKRVWRTYGPQALEHARRALDARPRDARAAAAFADAYMFDGSSKGLIKQAVTGAGKAFRENAKRLQTLDATYDAGLGYTLDGCFFHVAPWPLHNPHKAREMLRKAIDVTPSCRNHYHYAVVCYCQGDYGAAEKSFKAALQATPRGNEADFAPFIKSEAKRALALCHPR